jgi:two-component system response regulator MprA
MAEGHTSAMSTILVVDDEPAVRDALQRALSLEGYEVVTAGDGEAALAAHDERRPDAIVLDVQMPVLNGIDACRKLRAGGSRTPVLMLTARDQVTDRVAGLDAGADDYLVKPFALEELFARLRALLRRNGTTDESGGETLRFADVELDLAGRTARRGERSFELTRTEFALLELFMRHPGRVLSRSTIFNAVWEYDFGPSSNTLEVYVGYVRRKLEQDGEPRLLHTVRGIGYVLRSER